MSINSERFDCETDTQDNDFKTRRQEQSVLIDDDSDSEGSTFSIGAGRKLPTILGLEEDYTVDFEEGHDPENPKCFSTKKKLILSSVLVFCCYTSSYGSAVLGDAGSLISKDEHVSHEVSILPTSLFVLGYAIGPVIWGPASDLYGRYKLIVTGTFIYICLTFAAATAKDVQTIIICRFFSGFSSAAPMVIGPPIIVDLFDTAIRGSIITAFVAVLFLGPISAPIINGYIIEASFLGWRWTLYILGIMTGLACILLVFFFQETNAGSILSMKASRIRKKTNNWAIIAAHDKKAFSMKEIVSNTILQPPLMLSTEPILLLVTLYNSFVFGLLYLLLTAIPFIFGEEGYGFSIGNSQLPYISMFLGVELGALICIILERRYTKVFLSTQRLQPEQRLIPMIIGSIVFPIGLFWLGWSGFYYEKVHWIVPTIALFPVGFGILCIFMSSLNFIIECYIPYVSIATSANTMVRYGFAAAFPLFSTQMFNRLKTNWGCSLLGFIALILVPVPFLFFKFGKKLRQKSKYAYKG